MILTEKVAFAAFSVLRRKTNCSPLAEMSEGQRWKVSRK